MSGKAIGLSFNYGFQGAVSRTPDCVIEAKPVAATSATIAFGKPAVLNADNTFSAPSSVALTAANFAGVAVAIVKQLNTYAVAQDTLQGGAYAADEMADILQRGVIAVKVFGTPTAGGSVYVRTVLNGAFPDEVVGDFRAASDGGNTVQLTNCSWNTGLVDGNGVTELKIKSINN